MAGRQTSLLSFITVIKKKIESSNVENENREDNSEYEDEMIIKPSGSRKRNANTFFDSDDEGNQIDYIDNFDSPIAKKMKKSQGKMSFSSQSWSKFLLENSKNDFAKQNSEMEDTSKKEEEQWVHECLEFLMPEKIRDKYNHRPGHPEYDDRTLMVPDSFKEYQTPAMRQWWEIKSNHFDCILFFKVGKFYELYHMDAVTGVKEIGLSFMKGSFAHSGFPESAYGKMSSLLIGKGFKVARVEQTETPDMLAERCKFSMMKKNYKVVKRELCQITSQGTIVNNVQDADIIRPEATYMLSLTEDVKTIKNSEMVTTYGVCFIETSLGEFHIGQFDDDSSRMSLLSLITQYPPVLIIFPRNLLSDKTLEMINVYLSSASKEALAPEIQFLSSEDAIKMILKKKYFHSVDNVIEWPETIRSLLTGDGITASAKPEFNLAFNALGGALWYLADSCIDAQLIEMRNFKMYKPSNIKESQNNTRMIIDAATLINLHIIDNNIHSLYKKLDRCCTPFGKRLLLQWLASPLCQQDLIEDRQKAVKTLVENEILLKTIKENLYQIPDLERLLAKIHAMGNKHRSNSHPDSRAVLYEEKIYAKKKIEDFVSLLSGFQCTIEIVEQFSDITNAGLLDSCMKYPEDGGIFPNIKHNLEYFQSAFNHKQAEKDGIISPLRSGIDAEYDQAIEDINSINEELEEYRKSQEKFFGCDISYIGSDKKRFQLEVPNEFAYKITQDYHMEGTKKSAMTNKRYSTSKTKELVAKLTEAEERKQIALKDLARKIYEKFSHGFVKWKQAVKCLATLDVLISFALYRLDIISKPVCLPEISARDIDEPFMYLKKSYQPVMDDEELIPNDVEIGTKHWAPLLVLTGPNMGGKSTLMRQVALLTIMAHIGSYIPAESFKLSLVDRLLSRMGANDDIVSSRSTFDIELLETKIIIENATKHSLVFIDELGRGTATHDGIALAHSVIEWMIEKKTRTIFTTHYSELVLEYFKNPYCSLCHMGCMISENLLERKVIPEESIVFLYTLVKGIANRSHAFNAAYLAGVPKKVVYQGFKTHEDLYKRDMGIIWINELMDIHNKDKAVAFSAKWNEL